MSKEKFVSRVEENARIMAEYLKNLESISYDEIVDRLIDHENHYQIQFYNKHDIINNIYYSCISILKNNETGNAVEYLSMDQNTKDVYNNLIKKKKKKENIDLSFQIFINYDNQSDLACTCGDNVLIFPRAIVEELIDCSTEYSNKNPGVIYCIYGDKEIFIPKFLEKDKEKKLRL